MLQSTAETERVGPKYLRRFKATKDNLLNHNSIEVSGFTTEENNGSPLVSSPQLHNFKAKRWKTEEAFYTRDMSVFSWPCEKKDGFYQTRAFLDQKMSDTAELTLPTPSDALIIISAFSNCYDHLSRAKISFKNSKLWCLTDNKNLGSKKSNLLK